MSHLTVSRPVIGQLCPILVSHWLNFTPSLSSFLGSGCDKTRIVTKNCKNKVAKDKKESKLILISSTREFETFIVAICIFEKPKSVPWSQCDVSSNKEIIFQGKS